MVKSLEQPRRPGALQGRIKTATDFDTLPPDVFAAMEGGEEGASSSQAPEPSTDATATTRDSEEAPGR